MINFDSLEPSNKKKNEVRLTSDLRKNLQSKLESTLYTIRSEKQRSLAIEAVAGVMKFRSEEHPRSDFELD